MSSILSGVTSQSPPCRENRTAPDYTQIPYNSAQLRAEALCFSQTRSPSPLFALNQTPWTVPSACLVAPLLMTSRAAPLSHKLALAQPPLLGTCRKSPQPYQRSAVHHGGTQQAAAKHAAAAGQTMRHRCLAMKVSDTQQCWTCTDSAEKPGINCRLGAKLLLPRQLTAALLLQNCCCNLQNRRQLLLVQSGQGTAPSQPCCQLLMHIARTFTIL